MGKIERIGRRIEGENIVKERGSKLAGEGEKWKSVLD